MIHHGNGVLVTIAKAIIRLGRTVKHSLLTLSLFAFLVAAVTTGYAQKKSAVIGDMISRPNAILILNPPNDDQGFLLPQLSTTNRLSVLPASPVDDGLVVFDITEQSFYYWSSGIWVKGLGSGTLDQTLAYNSLTQKLTISGPAGNEVDLVSLKEIPSQVGQGGKYLTTDGVTLSWLTLSGLGTVTNINTGTGLTGGPITNTGTISISDGGVNTLQLADNAVTSAKLNSTGVAQGTYGTATQVPQFTVNAQGRITAATNTTITGVAPAGVAGGDLTGAYPNPTIAVNAISSAEITDGSIATADLASSSITAVKLANTAVTAGLYGTGTQVPQIIVDAQGRITSAAQVTITGAPPTGAAGGDLTGFFPNPTLAANAVTSAEVTDGTITSSDILDGTIATADLANASVTPTKLANTTVTAGLYGTGTQISQISVDAQGRITSAANVTITGAPPNGTAGGDLTGTYPNPTVTNNAIGSAEITDGTVTTSDILDGTLSTVDLANNSVTAAKLANTTVTAGVYGTGTQISQITIDAQGRITSAGNVAITGAPPTGAAGGDLSGSYPSPTVAEIRGNPVNAAILGGGDNGKALVWDGAQWVATVVPGLTLQTSYYSLDPSDFVAVKEDAADRHVPTIFEAENSFVTGEGNNKGEYIMAPVHLPQGANLTQMTIYYWDDSPNTMSVTLLRKNLATGVNDILNTWTSGANTTAILTQTTVLFNGMGVIANETYTYRILVQFDFNVNIDFPAEAFQRIYGIRLRYQY